MNDLSDLNLDNDSDNDEIESPTDGPAPDWMRAATSSGESSFSEDKAPDWLKSIRSGKGARPNKEEKPTSSQVPAASEAADGMSEMERLLAEEGIDLSTVAEERPAGSEGMSAKDWLIATSDDELVRKRLDLEPIAEMPSPTPPAPQSSDSSMSEIERLLAEEGIDLSTVAEERPAGSEGMSAKDWLISTSDDDLVRKRLDEPVTDLSSAEATPAQIEPHLDAADTEDDLPDWLQDVADDELPESGEVFAPVAELSDDDDDKMIDRDELPDWLQDVADDDEIFILEPSGPVATQLFEDEGDKMVVENDLPDWLKEVEEDQEDEIFFEKKDLTITPETDEEDEGDMMVVEDDLPDWLKITDNDDDLSVEPATDREISSGMETASASVLEQPVQAEAMAAGENEFADEEGLPDWLKEVEEESVVTEAPVVAEIGLPADSDKDEDLPDWLCEVDDEDEPVVVVAPVVAEVGLLVDSDEEEDLPDWLREVDDEDEPVVVVAPVVAEVGLLADSDEEEDLPDWLREVDDEDEPVVVVAEVGLLADSDEEEDLPDWLRETDEDEEPVVVMAPVAAEVGLPADSDEDEGLPDWLRETDEDEEPVVVMAPVVAEVGLPADSDEDEGLPDWLRETDEDEEPVVVVAPVVAEVGLPVDSDEDEGLPDWLQEVEAENDGLFEPSDPSPDPFADVSEEETIVEDELPDWLQEVQQEVEEDLIVEPANFLQAAKEVTPSAETVEVSDEAEGELPEWLKQIEIEDDVSEVDINLEAETITEPVGDDAAPVETEQPEAAEEIEMVDRVEEIAKPAPSASSTSGSSDLPNWLKKLREGGVEATSPSAGTIMPTPPTPQPVAPIIAALPQSAPLIVEPEPIPDDLPTDPAERLNLAQSARDRGDINEALRIYGSLVLSGAHLETIIEDAQQIVKTHPGDSRVLQLMGDAMVRDGRLQSALEAYRKAMTQLVTN